MSGKEFGRVVRQVMAGLPRELQEHLDNVVIDVQEEPDEGDFLDQPHRVLIFKNPLEDEFPDPKALEIEIRKTVVHELAHHFGWTDRDLERFDNTADPFGDEDPKAP